MTLTRRTRFLLVGGATAALIAGPTTAAFAGGYGGGGDHNREHVRPHCVTVYLTGDTKADVTKFERQRHEGKPGDAAQNGGKDKAVIEDYSAAATAQVCEDKHGKITVTIDPASIVAAETEAKDHGGH
jgi:hypothetical protein